MPSAWLVHRKGERRVSFSKKPPGGPTPPPPPPPPYGGSPPPPPPYGGGQGQSIPNYLVPSILTTLFCCLPAGIVAIVYAAQVNSRQQAGDIDGAMRASKNAKTWCFISLGVGLVLIVVGFLVGFIGALADQGSF
jgi:hypothetical protein